MAMTRFIRFLFASLISIGLAVAPLSSTLATGQRSSDQGMQMYDMSDAMPCCPDPQDQKARDCGSCPLAALCTLTIALPARDGAGALADRSFSLSLFTLPDDLLVDGLGEHPPDQPPRTIV